MSSQSSAAEPLKMASKQPVFAPKRSRSGPKTLKSLRKQADLTQKQLGFLLNLAPLTILRWEKGLSQPNASAIRRLAWALRVEEEDVVQAVINAS